MTTRGILYSRTVPLHMSQGEDRRDLRVKFTGIDQTGDLRKLAGIHLSPDNAGADAVRFGIFFRGRRTNQADHDSALLQHLPGSLPDVAAQGFDHSVEIV